MTKVVYRMKDKYHLGREMNVYLAKRNIVDTIYKSANLEGIAVSYPETYQIYNGGNIGRLRVSEIVAINNLKYAWAYLLDEPSLPDNYAALSELNRYVGSGLYRLPGKMRTFPVCISGTAWKPSLPDEVHIQQELAEHLAIENPTERAITIMLWAMRRQLFADGNKRSSMLFANKIMIDNGCGIIQIPIEKQSDFFTMLFRFYETNEMDELKQWIYDFCIDGIEMPGQSDFENKW